jgi:hypothetical protein
MEKTVCLERRTAQLLAQYKELGVLHPEGFSPHLCRLLKNGELAKFEPSLKGFLGGQEFSSEDYSKYEFTVILEISNSVQLYLSFTKDNICTVVLVDSREWSIFSILSRKERKALRKIGLLDLSLENFFQDISWEEAHEIILKHAGI